MTDLASYRPRHAANVVELDMGDGIILYDNAAKRVHHLSLPASIIWRLCDGRATVEELARQIAVELSGEFDRVFADVESAVAELIALGLVTDASAEDEGGPAGRPKAAGTPAGRHNKIREEPAG